MLSKERYDELVSKLEDILENSSDLISVEAWPYEDFLTSSGKLDSRKKFFSVKFNLLQFKIRAEKFTAVAAQMFQNINIWMNEFDDIYFIYDFRAVNGENSRIELEIKFDDLSSITKKILTK